MGKPWENGGLMGKPWENGSFSLENGVFWAFVFWGFSGGFMGFLWWFNRMFSWIYPLVNVYITNLKLV